VYYFLILAPSFWHPTFLNFRATILSFLRSVAAF
jgi:hypothetical protein